MSIFYLGAKPRIVPKEELLPEMYEDRYFLPGVIHGGEDYLIRVYLNDSHCESGIYSDEEYGDHAQFCIEYITADLIKEARELDPLLGDEFYQKLCEGENFCCDNDGKGDFAGIVDEWPKALYLTHSKLSEWADNPYPYEEAIKEYEVSYEEVLGHDFIVYAKSPEHAAAEFDRLSRESFFDFSDGYVTESHITEVVDTGSNKKTKFNDWYSDLEEKALDPQKIVIPLGDGFSLVAEKNPEPGYKEIFVYLRRDADECIYQDLAIVSEEYSYKDDGSGGATIAPIHGRYSVKVYSDPDNEDFKHDFVFGRYLETPCPYSEDSMCSISPDANECRGEEHEQAECAYRKGGISWLTESQESSTISGRKPW